MHRLAQKIDSKTALKRVILPKLNEISGEIKAIHTRIDAVDTCIDGVEIEAARPSAERLLKLARITRKILDKYGLRVDVSQTMCLTCTGCDITPYRDI